jgi:nucleoside-diphosphate-sugar epimerase
VCESGSEIGCNEVDTYTANISMNASFAGRMLGWRPQVAARDGIASLVAEYISKRGNLA